MKKTFAFILGITAFSYAMADSVTPAGMATFKNGVQIPAYSVSYFDTSSESLTTSNGKCPCSFKFTVPVKQAYSLKLLNMDVFPYVLAPSDATVEGQQAMNGSASMTITSSQATIKLYKLYNRSAIVAASRYFSNAREMLAREGTTFDMDSPPKGLKSLRKDQNTAFYSYPSYGRTTHGVATFLANDDDNPLITIEVTVDNSNMKLATTILNFYYHQTKSLLQPY